MDLAERHRSDRRERDHPECPSVQALSYLFHVESGYPATVQGTFNFTTPLAVNTTVPVLQVITVLDSTGG